MIVVAYDISDDGQRKKAADACLDFGLMRIQNSVFSGPISWNRAEAIGLKINEICSGETDRVALMHLCKECGEKTIVLKKQRKPDVRQENYIIVGGADG